VRAARRCCKQQGYGDNALYRHERHRPKNSIE
jgi:hypothetical protein